MMKFMRSAKGSISIFLCLIMLPMVTYSSMIIDATRLQSARTSISSAGDLTMNAALSEYEQILEDMYGLFAVAKTEEELKPALKAYFAQTIEAHLISGDTAQDYKDVQKMSGELVDMIFNKESTPEDELTNFLEMEVMDFNYSGVNGATLANPAVMKRQIIDYMKYKGPVSLTSTLFSKLDFLKNTSKQTEAVEKKLEYVHSLGNIEEACKATWILIEGIKDEDDNLTRNGYNYYAQENKDKMYGISGVIEGFLDNSQKNYGYMSRCILYKKRNAVQQTIKWDDIDISGYSKSWTVPDAIPDVPPQGQPEPTVDELSEYLTKVYENATKIIDMSGCDYGTINSNYITFNLTDISEDQGLDEMVVTITPNMTQNGVYATKGNIEQFTDRLRLFQNDTKLEGVMDWYIDSLIVPTDQFLYDLQKRYEAQTEIYDVITTDNGRYLAPIKAAYLDFDTLITRYNSAWQKYSEKYDSKLKADYKSSNPDASEDEINGYVSAFHEDRDGEYYQHMREYWLMAKTSEAFEETKYKQSIENLLYELSDNYIYVASADYFAKQARKDIVAFWSNVERLSYYLGEIDTALGVVLEKIQDSETKKGSWQTAIDQNEASSTKSMMQSDLDTTTDGLEKADVEAFKTLVFGLKSDFEKLRQDIEALKFLDVPVIKTPDAAKSSSYYNHEAFNATSPVDLISLATQISETNFDRTSLSEERLGLLKSAELLNGKNDLIGSDNPEEKFYYTLKSICEPYKQELSDAQKQQQNNTANMINSSSELDADGNPKNSLPSTNNTAPTQPQTSSGEKATANFADIYKDIAGEQGRTEENNRKAQSISVSTEEKESYDDDAKKAENSLSAATKLLDSLKNLTTTAAEYAYLEEYFTEMFTCQTDPKLKPENLVLLNGYTINSDPNKKGINTNTAWYGKEIEYIIWGDSNLDTNLRKTEAWIYTMRFALNAIYAFTAADIQSFALEVATAIAGWTVIGVPIVQACITIAIALAESAYDLHLLKEGKDVAIYKSATTFVCSPTGLLSQVAEEIVETAVDKAAEAIESQLNNTIDDIASRGYEKISDAKNEIDQFCESYISQQRKSIESSITDQFVTPILNSMTPVLSEINGNVDNISGAVDGAFDEAWNQIGDNIQNKMTDGTVKDLTLSLYGKITNEQKNAVKTKIKEYFTQIANNVPTTESLREMLVGNGTNGARNGLIRGWLNQINDEMNKTIEDLTSKMQDKIMQYGDQAIGDLKSIIHDEVSDFSSQITNKVTSEITSTISDYAGEAVKSVDSATSGGFTLNYKEYCKLIVFIKLIEGKEKVMLLRTSALIEANVNNAKVNKNPNFKMKNANTLVSINAKVKLGTLFPWAVSIDENETMGETRASLDLSHLGSNYVIIDYNAINGY